MTNPRISFAASLAVLAIALCASPAASQSNSDLDDILGGPPAPVAGGDDAATAPAASPSPVRTGPQTTVSAPRIIPPPGTRRSIRQVESATVQAEAPQRSKEEIEQELFEEAMDTLFPLDEVQVRTVKRRYNDLNKAATRRDLPTILPQNSINVSLEPGTRPEVIQLGQGEVTALTFFDVTGSPYPVQSVVVGNPEEFSVEAPTPGGNLITVSPLSVAAQGNLVISLVDQPVPIVVRLNSGSNVVNYRVDMRVQARGPNAPVILVNENPGPPITNEVMTSFLDGMTPEGAVRLELDGDGPARAWLLDDVLYLRTPMTLISPSPSAQATGAAGLKVYEMPNTPVILASDDGKMVRIKVNEPEVDIWNRRAQSPLR